MTTTRDVLATLARGPMPADAHAGLWLDKYLWSEEGKEQDKVAQHLSKVVERPLPDGWKEAQERWERALRAAPRATGYIVRFFTITTRGRCVVGLGSESPWENNIRLHQTWGVPLIPGSALKGLASSYAHRLNAEAWSKQTSAQQPKLTTGVQINDHSTLFGTTDEQGCVVFHDALWAADNTDNGLRRDVLTVHHRDYYMASGDNVPPPADWDSPVPVPFLSLKGKFVVALEGPAAWVEAAVTFLKAALESDGIGAKTSSGYGRMTWGLSAEETARRKKRDTLMQTIEALPSLLPKNESSRLDGTLRAICGEDDVDLVREAATALKLRVQNRQLMARLNAVPEDMRKKLEPLLRVEADAPNASAPSTEVTVDTLTRTLDLEGLRQALPPPGSQDASSLRTLLANFGNGSWSKGDTKKAKALLKDLYGNDGGWVNKLFA